MNNAEKFKSIFGIYATELWAMPEEKFLEWLNAEALGKQERETQEKPFPFVVGQLAEMFFDGKWEKGEIVAGYRFNDGVVTIETEDGRKLWCGQDRTDIYRPYQEDEAWRPLPEPYEAEET